MTQPLVGEKKGHIFYLTLNRPEKRNAITFEMIEEMSATIEGLILDAEVRVIIVKGEGKVFSAGVDFQSLAALVGRFMTDAAAGGASIRADISHYQNFINRFETVEIPIICAMQGRVLGLGLEMMLACDIRLRPGESVDLEQHFGSDVAPLGRRIDQCEKPGRVRLAIQRHRRYEHTTWDSPGSLDLRRDYARRLPG